MEAKQEQFEKNVADEHRDGAEFAMVVELDADALACVAGGLTITKFVD